MAANRLEPGLCVITARPHPAYKIYEGRIADAAWPAFSVNSKTEASHEEMCD